jgi:lysine decarboxylase
MYPTIHPEFHLPVGLPVASVEGVAHDVTAYFVTSPSYVGTLSDVAGLAAVTRQRGVPLVVDQAWGAHLDFLPGAGAMALGADASVTSIHKALMGYSQTAVVNMRDGLVLRSAMDRCVDLVSTTSPSGTLFASIDATRAVLERDGEAAFERTLSLVGQMRRRLARVPGVVVIDEHTVECAVDPFKVTLVLPRTGVSGLDIAADLWELGHGPETADRDTLVLSVTLMDEPAFLLEMADLIAGFIEAHRDEARPAAPTGVWRVEPEVVVTPRQAFFAKRRRIRLSDAAGEVSAEQFCPYPPGVPLLAPGERVTPEGIAAIQAAGRVGRVAYSSDATLETIEVIDEL